MSSLDSKSSIITLNPSYSPSLTRENGHAVGSWPSYFKESVEYKLASPNVNSSMNRYSNLRRSRKYNQSNRTTSESSPLIKETILIDEGRNSSLPQATLNAVNLLLGVGVLSLPYALRSCGLLIGMGLLMFFSFVTNYTGKLLGICLEYEPGMKTYPDIGEAAFGRRGRIFISIIFFIELFTACTMFIILIGDNLQKLIPVYTESTLMIIGFLIILPTTWTSHLSILSYFSIIGIISSFLLLFALLYIGGTNPMNNVVGGSYIHPLPIELVADIDRIPLAIGLTMVGYGGHAVFPSIYYSMKDRSKYSRMLDYTYVLVFLVYGLIAVVGYLMYGTLTEKEITLNLMTSNGGWISTFVTWTIAFNPMTKYALTLNPVALSTEEILLPQHWIEYPTTFSAIIQALIRSILGGASLICALYIPNFARVTAFLGALSAMLVSAIFPCICYLKLFYERLSQNEIFLNVGISILCTILAILGTGAAIFSTT